MSESEYWEQPEQVERFATREPDRRLRRLIESHREPERTRVLDLGCAGGRNTVLLADRGFDVYALDSSAAMVARTRERLAEIIGEVEAMRRVQCGVMEDLGDFADRSFRLVVALGVYHNAATRDAWRTALRETHRVLEPGGLLLVSNFSPRTRPRGALLDRVSGDEHVYVHPGTGRMYLLNAEGMDREMESFGLIPEPPTETVEVETELGRRVTVNGLYRRRSGGTRSDERGPR